MTTTSRHYVSVGVWIAMTVIVMVWPGSLWLGWFAVVVTYSVGQIVARLNAADESVANAGEP